MKAGDKLIPLVATSKSCTILNAPKPPKKWRVRYEGGGEKLWSKSHLKKYYYVGEN